MKQEKKQLAITAAVMFLLGALLGVVSKLLDIYTSNLGNMFSQMSVWVLIGTVIAIFSKTRKAAAVNVFVFCVGMLIAYYICAELTHSVYGTVFIIGWSAFSLCSPAFAALTWMTKEKGSFPKLIAAAILLVTLLISVVVFRGPRIYDIVILMALVYFLFFCKIKR